MRARERVVCGNVACVKELRLWDPGRNFQYRKDAPVKAIKLQNKLVL